MPTAPSFVDVKFCAAISTYAIGITVVIVVLPQGQHTFDKHLWTPFERHPLGPTHNQQHPTNIVQHPNRNLHLNRNKSYIVCMCSLGVSEKISKNQVAQRALQACSPKRNSHCSRNWLLEGPNGWILWDESSWNQKYHRWNFEVWQCDIRTTNYMYYHMFFLYSPVASIKLAFNLHHTSQPSPYAPLSLISVIIVLPANLILGSLQASFMANSNWKFIFSDGKNQGQGKCNYCKMNGPSHSRHTDSFDHIWFWCYFLWVHLPSNFWKLSGFA